MNINPKGTLTSTSNDENLGFPSLGYYGILATLRGAKWLGVSSSAEDKKIFDFVLNKLEYLPSKDTPIVSEPLHTRITKTTVNFSRLFEAGKSLMKMVKKIDLLSNPSLSFPITSPRELLEANLALRDLAERVIFQDLSPLQIGELTEVQKLCMTQTKFLAPLTLSQMLDGNISIEEALLLIACLGLQKNRTIIQVCDPTTGNFHKDFHYNMLSSYRLVFLDPDELLKKLPQVAYDPKKDMKDTSLLFEGTKLIVKAVLGMLEGPVSSLSKPLQQKLAKDLLDASIDHEKVRAIIDKLEEYFPDDQKEVVLNCKTEVNQSTKFAFAKCQEIVASLPTQEKFDNELKNIEAQARLIKASQQKEALKAKFKLFQTNILKYLGLLSQKYQIKTSSFFSIKWIIQGTEITETMEITKTCAISRRVLYPTTSENNRSDLVYFSSDDKEESVVSLWKSLCKKYSLSDRQLVDYLLLLYKGEKIPKDLMPFLSFLMVLLLGKEPAYDSASIAANFILLFSIKLGIHSFEEALSRMPMVPQGAIAAKQFLLHVSGIPLDALARVQYKDKKQVPESTFLPTSVSFLGSANDWIQVYDDVATTALECCRCLFFQDLDPENSHLLQLKKNLESLVKNKLEVWDIPLQLRLFSERKKLIKNPNDIKTSVLLCKKNLCAAQFLLSMGQTVDVKNNASEQCARFLTKGIDLSNPSIQELQQIIEKQDSQNWQYEMLSVLEVKKDFGYETIKKTIMSWDPTTICRNLNLNPYNYSDTAIRQLDEAWDTHFLSYMSPYQYYEDFAELRKWTLENYRLPVSYYDLASAINPENGINDEDPLAKWAISYILERHPLK